MLKLPSIESDSPRLQAHPWPPVPEFSGFGSGFRAFIAAGKDKQRQLISELHDRPDQCGELLNNYLSTIYAYHYGYTDSPCYLGSDVELESDLLGAKLVLENALIEDWLPIAPVPELTDQKMAVQYLRGFLRSNGAVRHGLYDYLRDEAPRDKMVEFLCLDTCRNEIVDDEIALLVCGLQGNMKKVIASNLWDECGNGNLEGFHTYWLRRLVNRLGEWDHLPQYRMESKPWFSSIVSNTFNALVTRSVYKLRAYGMFLASEARVSAHFMSILAGLERTGLDHKDIGVYFEAHLKIDPHHTAEILTAFANQVPALSELQIAEVVRGAHFAVAAGIAQYDRMLHYFRSPACVPFPVLVQDPALVIS
jgi:hypothetical protein